MNAFLRRISLLVLAVSLAALAAAGSHAVSDCFEPLRDNAGWRCHADVPGGQAVDYCLEHTNAFGADPASRFFKLIATGPYPGSCSCRAKGKLPGAAFGEDSSFLCLYRDTDAVVSGKITKRKMTGQTFSAAYNLRTVFRCAPDPACDVPPVVDADLTPESGALGLAPNQSDQIEVVAAGRVALGYLSGCGGYTNEAPTFVFRVSGSPSGFVRFGFAKTMDEADQAGILVMTPFGGAHCAENTVQLPPEAGSYAVWVRARTPGAPVGGYLSGLHSVP
jgi:hypothetical protein